MKKTLLSLIGSLYLCVGFTGIIYAQNGNSGDIPAELIHYQNEIATDFLKKHLAVISADSMEGRDTGMPGQKKAARYLAEQYKKMGLTPVGDDGTFFQNFELSAVKKDSTIFELYKGEKLVGRSVESPESTADFYRAFGGSDTLSGEIVFAGFGINDPERGINHLEERNLRGKWVMVFREIPHVVEGDTLIHPEIDGRSRFQQIIAEKQAAGMLLIPRMSEDEFTASAEAVRIQYNEPTNMGLEYLEDDPGGFTRGYNVVKPELAARILGIENGAGGLAKYRESLIDNIRGFTPRKTGYSLIHTPYSSRVSIDTENVAALLEGSDPKLRDEVVVLTAHYDHVGIGQPDSTGDAIYNGADDDGSGTVALLNIGQALSQAKANGHVPKRSIMLLHVSAEEVGLLGSRYYSDHPIIPMEKTIANINIDMIGRIDPEHEKEGITDYSYIIGSEIISSDLDSLLKVANAEAGQIQLDKSYNDLQDPNQFYRRSDHWNFGRFRVPFIFFFTGVHEDYHRPSDEIHKIRFEKMAKIVRTIYATTVVVANTETPPAVDNEEFIDITKSHPR